MKAVLHIGTPKTATTHLQRTLVGNRKALRRAGVVYPDLLNHGADHITLFCAVHPHLHPFQNEYGIRSKDEIPLFRERLRRRLQNEVAAAPEALFVMSSENLSGNLQIPGAIETLHDLLAGVFDEITVVVYLRRQDDALLSMYSEFMRKGFSELTFDQFIGQNLKTPAILPYLDHDRLLRRWAAVFGQDNLRPRLFEPSVLAGGTLVSDFLSLLPGQGAGLAAEIQIAPPVNISLSAPVLEFLRLIRPVVPFGFKGHANPERAALMRRINALPPEPRPVMSHAQSERIMAYFAAGNEKIAKSYFPDQEDGLFPTDARSAETSNLGQLGLEEFKRYFRLVFD